MLERTLNAKIVKAVKSRGGYILKIHGNIYQPKAVDLVICYRGRFVAIESKVGRNTATDIQKQTLREIKRAGGKVGVAYTVEDVTSLLDEIDAEEDNDGNKRFDRKATKEAPSNRARARTTKAQDEAKPKRQ